MNRKFLHTQLIQLLPGITGILLLLIVTISADGQSNKSGYSDAARQRLLIRITAHYIHTISQGQIDMDSAVRIPCNLYGLSPFLVYNEGYNHDKQSIGTRLLETGQVKEASALVMNLKGESRVRLLMELGSYFVFKPGADKADLDKAAKYINQAIAISETTQWEIESLSLQGYLYHQSGMRDESGKIFVRVLTLCKQSGNDVSAAQALLSAGELLPYGHPSRLSHFEKALAIFETHHLKEKQIETLSEINVEHFVFKRYDAAEQVTRKIIELETQINFHHQQYAYDVLVYLSKLKGNFTNALSYSNKSLESLNSYADSIFLSLFYARRGDLYSSLDRNDEALAWFDKALEKKTNENKLYWFKAFLLKARLLNNLQREKEALLLIENIIKQFPPVTTFEKMYIAISLGQAYEQLKKFDLAENQYTAFLKLAENLPDAYIHGEFPAALSQISALYRITGKITKARELLERGKPYGFQLGRLGKSLYYYDLFKIDSTEKKYFEAIKDLQMGNAFRDSAFSDDQRKKVNELLIKYEAEKKDKDIKLLNSQNQLQRVRADEANRTKNITLAGGGLLLIIFGLLFNRYLIKQRNHRALEANQKELDQKNVFLETLNADQDKLLKEKEWLIREVHHRVKNNLQMVTSLLYSQSIYLEDDTARQAVKDSLRRMQAMSLIHQKLYKDENTSTIAMREYINDLVRYLRESFDVDNQISFKQKIEPLDLDVLQAIPLGLIITESIVNAIKYAFLNGQKGIVCIDFQFEGTDNLMLKISDNGIGLPVGLNTMEHHSLGLDLMHGLTKQLKGILKIENNNGVHITLRFQILNK